MAAYLALSFAILTRLAPSLFGSVGRNLTAVGGSLLLFGARRPRREFAVAALALAATDLALTRVAFHLPFRPADYAVTWLWYLTIPFAGLALLRHGRRRSRAAVALRAMVATLASAGSFFVLSNGAFWLQTSGKFYPRTAAGLIACYAAGLPFFRNDLVSTAVVLALFSTVSVSARLVLRRAEPGHQPA